MMKKFLWLIILISINFIGFNVWAGWYSCPATGKVTKTSAQHPHNKGCDIANKTGTTIGAARGGTVVRCGWQTGYGRTIDIDHGGGRVTRYAHLSRYLVKFNNRVSERQKIAEMGNSGTSKPHLHWEVRPKSDFEKNIYSIILTEKQIKEGVRLGESVEASD